MTSLSITFLTKDMPVTYIHAYMHLLARANKVCHIISYMTAQIKSID